MELDARGFPESIWRFPTGEAIRSLVERLNLFLDPLMQDHEIELADSRRIFDFIETYESGELSDDEKFLLMAIIIASFDEDDSISQFPKAWQKTLELIEQEIELHFYTVVYWSAFEMGKLRKYSDEQWQVSGDLRPVFERTRCKFNI